MSRPFVRSLVWSCLVFLACGLGPVGPTGPAGSPPRQPTEADLGVLLIGNSLTYTNDLPGMLEALLELGGIENAIVESVAYPNYGLEDHWARGDAARRIADGGWDVVALQQGPSATGGRPSLLEYSDRYAGPIRAAGARPALYMVWPSQARLFDFDGVSDSYATAAVEVDGLLFPAGEAWREAWALDPDTALYGPDGFHPSLFGTYLAALVMYEQLSGRSALDLPPRIPTGGGAIPIEPAQAMLLQTAAHQANAKHARP